MSYRLADVCFPPGDPAVLARDLAGLGCQAVGLYVVNLSIPGCDRDAGYVADILGRGFGILPIVTPGNVPPADLDLVGALRSWGAPPCPVMFDLERFSEPGGGWVAQKIAELSAAAYAVGLYGDAAHQAQYAGEPWAWRCLADWTYSPGIAAGYEAQQWTNQAVGGSGTGYDLSEFSDSLVLWGPALTVPQLGLYYYWYQQTETWAPTTPTPPLALDYYTYQQIDPGP